MPSLASAVREFCRRHGLRLNTDLGQHFLVDQTVLDAIIEAGKIAETDHIVEIGAGIGILTRELLRKTTHVLSIEIDDHLIPLMQMYLKENGENREPETVRENALHVPFPSNSYKIIANIPYHITSPLLRHAFLESVEPPTSLTLLIQREVAERICDDEDASLLTIIVGLFGKARLIRIVPPSSFLPPPKVDSAVLQIDCYDHPLAGKEVIERVMTLAKVGFSQKRKMLRNTLGSLPDGLQKMQSAGIDPTRRPQTLALSEWIALAKTGL